MIVELTHAQATLIRDLVGNQKVFHDELKRHAEQWPFMSHYGEREKAWHETEIGILEALDKGCSNG